MNVEINEIPENNIKLIRKKLKIGYIMQANSVDMSSVSGPRHHINAVIQRLNQRGHHVRMVAIQSDITQWSDDLSTWYPCTYSISKNPLFHIIESPVRFLQSLFHLPFFRFFDSIRFSDACISALRGYDVLYERDSTISYGGIIAARRLGIPIAMEINGDLIEEWKQMGLNFSKNQESVVHFITGQTYRHVTHLVTVGETLRKRLIQRWKLDPSHISVVRNGAEIDLFADPGAVPDLRSRYKINSGPMVIFTGSFQPWHGVDLILDAFNRVVPLMPDATMVFVGDGQFWSDLKTQASSLNLDGQVVFTGKVDHKVVAQLMDSADIAVIYHRGNAAEIVETPLKLFEYMAAGKAIIAPDVPNMKRILTNRSNALLIQPDDPIALGNAMVELINDAALRKSLGCKARDDAIKNHSWDHSVSELETILYRLTDKNSRGKND